MGLQANIYYALRGVAIPICGKYFHCDRTTGFLSFQLSLEVLLRLPTYKYQLHSFLLSPRSLIILVRRRVHLQQCNVLQSQRLQAQIHRRSVLSGV